METVSITKLVSDGNMAKFSHYLAGNLYYNIQTEIGTFQFPIKTVDKVDGALFKLETKKDDVNNNVDIVYSPLNKHCFTLSEDLGITPFASEYKAINLMRWIRFAIKSEELIRIA